jgi:hypothetical protein
LLEIREKILSLFKERKKLSLTDEAAAAYELIEFKDHEFIYSGGDNLSKKEDFRYSLSPKQALAKICSYYRAKGNIKSEPGYKEVYAMMSAE